ncbi:MAG: CSLREA domain-containing protein [Anaerolineae bacterium]|nr:CSLREA domain-containing protein [Anaerolineae bacterium]
MKRNLFSQLLILIVLLALSRAGVRAAATYTVTKTADTFDGTCNADCSLREAISAANNDPGSTVNIPAGTYTITRAGFNEDANATGDFDILADMTISGAGYTSTIIDAADLDRAFDLIGLPTPLTVTISSLTVQNGDALNPAPASGGGIDSENVNLRLEDCLIQNNTAEFGGGLALQSAEPRIAEVYNCLIRNNTTRTTPDPLDPLNWAQGGGIAANHQLDIFNSEISSNTAMEGGAIFGSDTNIFNSLIRDNTGTVSTGGVGNGGITVISSTFTNNSPTAISTSVGLISDSTFTGNSSDIGGAAIYGANLTVTNNAFVGNSATEGTPGGAIFARYGTTTIINNTFANNSAASGGAVAGETNPGSGFPVNINLSFNTFRGNTATSGASIDARAATTITARANIFANGTGGHCAVSADGDIASTGYNLADNTTCQTYLDQPSDLNNTNPLLGTLGFNGGLTQTIPLLANSPAIDIVPSGVCESTDQRGFPRPQGPNCDSGSFESGADISQPGPTYTVTTVEDSNDGLCGQLHCTLREAIIAANDAVGSNIIEFGIPATATGIQTIVLNSLLPTVTGPVTIDGATQPGYSTLPLIEINASALFSGEDVLTINASGSTVRALTINRFPSNAITINASTARIENNVIGLNSAVTQAYSYGSPGPTSPRLANGVVINAGANSATIVGNWISNGWGAAGLLSGGNNALVENNRFGVNFEITAELGSVQNALDVDGSNNTIRGNIISSAGTGILLDGPTNTVQNNSIGTNPGGTLNLGNNTLGISVSGLGSIIGGAAAGQGNRIAFNGNNPVEAGAGVAVNGGSGSRILGNAIYSNAALGIDLGDTGITPNDPLDEDVGTNELQNFPLLTGVQVGTGTVTIAGTLNSAPSQTYRIEFFASPSCDASGNGEGQRYLGTVNTTTNANGDATFNVLLSTTIGDDYLSATATDPANNTSEFSPCLYGSNPPQSGPTFTVNTTADADDELCTSLHCTLREAINAANAAAGANTIAFGISGAGVKTIQPTTALPTVTGPTTIDGTTQPGYSGAPLIELDGNLLNANSTVDGLVLSGGNSTVRGLIVMRFPYNGIVLTGAGGSSVRGCYIGVDAGGTLARGNGRNTASSTDGYGIAVRSPSNTIGGVTAGDRNVISANRLGGVALEASLNIVSGNYIGTNVAGSAGLGNGRDGVIISGSGNLIGGTGSEAGNLIAHNGTGCATCAGIRIAVSGAAANTLYGNRIHSNAGLGIDLGTAGVTPNDTDDPDTGANQLQNFPVLLSAQSNASETRITGSLNSAASTAYRMEFFSSPSCDANGSGEGRVFLSATSVTTDGGGDAAFEVNLSLSVSLGHVITATATDPNGNTSEFSTCRTVETLREAPQRNYFTTATPTLTWTRVQQASGYEIQVDNNADFSSPEYSNSSLPGTALSVTTSALADGTYYWRVRGRNANGIPGAWSLADSFVVDVP